MRRSANSLIKLGVAVLILYAIATKLDVEDILRTLLSINSYAIVLALFFALVQMLLAAARLSAIVALYGRLLPLGASLRVTLEGMFFGQTFVSFLGGDALRIWRIRGCGLCLNEATGAVASDRMLGIVVNHLVVLAALPWLLERTTAHTVRFALIALAVAGVVGIGLVLLLAFLPGRLGLFRKLPAAVQSHRLVQLLLSTATIGRHLFTPNREVLAAALLSLLIALTNCILFGLLLLGWGIALPVAISCALIVPAVLEIAMLPISVAGWGVREGTAIVAFGAFGVTPEIAFGCSVVFALILLAVSLIGGLLWVVDRREIGNLAAIELQARDAGPLS